MKKFFLIVLLIIFSFTSCEVKEKELNIKEIGNSVNPLSVNKSESDTNENVFSMNQPSVSESELKEAILYYGNISAYNELSVSYLDHCFQEEFLFYAMIMANKYDYPQAYYDVFDCFLLFYLSDITKIDEQSAKLAIEYLIKANERGHHQAKEIVEKFSITRNKNSKQQIIMIFKE